MKTVSIIIPTLGRPEGLERCLKSVASLDYDHRPEVIVLDGEGTVPEKVKMGVEKSTGEYVCYAANDMEFSPDCLKAAVEHAEATGKGLVSFNAGPVYPDKGNICEHFIVRRSLIPKLVKGEIFDTDFFHCGCDNFLWAQCEKLSEADWCEKAVIVHHHFTKGTAFDDIYKKGWSKVEQDRETLRRKLEQL